MASLAVAVFFFAFIVAAAEMLVAAYCEKTNIYLTEIQQSSMDVWVNGLALCAAVLLFVVLFLFLMGQKLLYLRKIICGIESFREHRMDYELPLEGENELTELARSMNYLAKTEREIAEKEKQVREERENMIRSLSHDIRTPLTTILSYSEYMEQKEQLTQQEIEEYTALIRRKAEQIKTMTDGFLEGNRRNLQKIENGRMLMEQLVEEWIEVLEEDFQCEINLEMCDEFSGEFDIEELRRVFDNLASNIRKYADVSKPVELTIFTEENILKIQQTNRKKAATEGVESYGIGFDSMRQIAKNYHGSLEIDETSSEFFRITLLFSL